MLSPVMIHWDRRREILERWSESEVEKDRQRFAFEAATSIALAYVDFSEVVGRATSLQ